MKSRQIAAVVSLTAAVCGAPAARADVKAVGTITIDSPQLNAALQSATPEQRKKLAAIGLANRLPFTLYILGSHMRTDIGPISVYADTARKTQLIVNRATKTMSSSSIDPGSDSQSAGTAVKITSTGKTARILGHIARQYKISGSSAATGVSTTGEIWAAPDIPGPKVNPFGSQLGNLYAPELFKIKGLPLRSTIKTSGGYAGTTTIKGTVTAVSQAPLPARVFSAPSNYHEGSVMPMGMPAP